ncbi:hypothetical protein ACFOVU_10065 [Nocardiopsis sediminis]|uniref:Uncharacterized protein n=1 Tax=Nocardiopsis sediminis TaxID=1778267 RepID=A0ABV8FJJ6_9ACTN
MKFELVEPEDWDDTTENAEDAAEANGNADPVGADESEPQDPHARLRASTARLRTRVRDDVADLSVGIGRLMARVSQLDPELADSGHAPATSPPTNFRAERFGTNGWRRDSN